jgi:hypothetical protein
MLPDDEPQMNQDHIALLANLNRPWLEGRDGWWVIGLVRKPGELLS